MTRIARSQKSTCRSCNRSVFLVIVDDSHVIVDPELIDVIVFEGQPSKVLARKLHAAACIGYQREARQRDLAAARKIANGAVKRALSGKREPG